MSKNLKTNKSIILWCIIFFCLAILVIGFSCYKEDHSTIQKTTVNQTISTTTFLHYYNHKNVKNLMLMPKNRKKINVSGNYKVHHKNYNFQSVVNYKQL